MKTFRYGSVKVSVQYRTDSIPRWEDTENLHHEFRVTAQHGTARYSAPAWGSLKDWQDGRDPDDEDYAREMARLVVEELGSAASDPDEFIDLMIGDAKGREALGLGKEAEGVVATAQRFGDAILKAADAARAEEEGSTA
ncbi:MAG: hypothetical protein ACREDF_02670 [Thermoplasmata archaeon]